MVAFEDGKLYYKRLDAETKELLDKTCEKCGCECEEPCELIRELKRYLW